MQGFCDFDFLSDSCPPAANNYSIQAAVSGGVEHLLPVWLMLS